MTSPSSGAAPRARWARILVKLSLVLGGTLLALGVAEVGVRILYPHARDHVVPAGLFEMDEHVGWRLGRGKRGVHRSRYFEAEYRSNDLGFRGGGRDAAKAPGVYRMLVYGDSQVFGWGLPEEERFTELLEERLDAVEIWNLAVPGYGLGQQVIAYETAGVGYDADEVSFLVSPSTLFRLPFDYIFRKPKPRFRLDDAGVLQLDPVAPGSHALSSRLYGLLSPFYLPYFLDRRLQELRHRGSEDDEPAGPIALEFGDLARQILLRAKRRAAKGGQRMSVLASFADPDRVPGLAGFAEENGIDVLWILVDPDDEGLIFGPHDRHWNEEAHRRIADQLMEPLSRRTASKLDSERTP